jgi:uncharacterized membrane protein YhaH (DUF805 family)
VEELNPVQWAVRPLKKYADFSGRAPRAEYWWYALLVSLVGLATGLVDYLSFSPVAGNYRPLTILFMLVLIVPWLAVVTRRFHDSSRSGWWCVLKLGSYGWYLRAASADSMTAYQALPAPYRLLFSLAAVGCGLTLLVLMLARTTEGANRYGPDPYGPGELEEVFA